MKRAIVAASAMALVFVGGCTSYYKVTDLNNGKSYYTTQLDKKSNGAAEIKDARTGNTINIQNSEVDPITKEEFDVARYSKPEEEKKPAPSPFK